jgi:hypothetical protein
VPAFGFVNNQASKGPESVMPSIAEPVLGTRAAVAVGDAEGDWLCVWCFNAVATDNDRFKFEGKGHFAFSNPDGIPFRIMTFSRTLGCRQDGAPTLEYTWFPGHAWSFCLCDRCGQHLGWYYAGKHHFAGLVIDRLVRRQCVRN